MSKETIVDIYCHILPDAYFQEMIHAVPRLGNLATRLRSVTKLMVCLLVGGGPFLSAAHRVWLYPLKADILRSHIDVCLGPIADIWSTSLRSAGPWDFRPSAGDEADTCVPSASSPVG
jgi:hypothetical protein